MRNTLDWSRDSDNVSGEAIGIKAGYTIGNLLKNIPRKIVITISSYLFI